MDDVSVFEIGQAAGKLEARDFHALDAAGRKIMLTQDEYEVLARAAEVWAENVGPGRGNVVRYGEYL